MLQIIVGGQFGDEGKGKIVSYLCWKNNYDIVARGGVGPNAGHTVTLCGKEYKVHMVPSGFISEKSRLLIGPGVLINPSILYKEISDLKNFKVEERLKIDNQCGIIEYKHIYSEEEGENKEISAKIGTTKTGCGPAQEDRVKRIGKLARDIKELERFLGDVPGEINEAIEKNKKILIEGTQGFGLSLYHGTYPYVTSKDTTASGILADVGVGPKNVDEVIVVFKAHVSRVGAGEFKTEMPQEEAKKLGIAEYGTTTGRPRRIGYFDFELAKRSVKINSATSIALTNIDKWYKCARMRNYEDLALAKLKIIENEIEKETIKKVREYMPETAKEFIEKIEQETKVPVKYISTGAEIEDTIER